MDEDIGVHSEEIVTQVIDLSSQGHVEREISRRVGIPRSTIGYILRRRRIRCIDCRSRQVFTEEELETHLEICKAYQRANRSR